MKVLLVSAHSEISGANKSMCVLDEHLIKYGCDVTIALRKQGEIVREIENRGLKYVVLKNYTWTTSTKQNKISKINLAKFVGNILLQKRIKDYLISERFDIVHNNSISSFLVAKCSQKLGIPTIWHFREFLEEDHNLTIFKLYRPDKIINKGSAGIAISSSILKKYQSKYKLPISLIYNGIEYSDFWCERNILMSEQVNIAVVGRLCPGKNQLEIIKALTILGNKGVTNFNLHIVGNKEEHSEYYTDVMKYLSEEGNAIKDKVLFDGIITDIASMYQETDIVVVPSVSEAFGRVAIEAMYSGCYVIGANTAGTSEILDDRFSIKYTLGNINELATAIEKILSERNKYADIAKQGQQYAIQNFTAEQNAEHIYNLYKNVTNRDVRRL